MTDIVGTIENGRTAQADFPGVYTGTVGIRDRDGFCEIAFLGRIRARNFRGVDGTLAGEPYRMVSLDTSSITDGMMTANVIPIAPSTGA
jgi:hypothetical protein